jgi:hypothetical protein
VLVARGDGTVHRNVRDCGYESEEPSRVKIVFGFLFAVNLDTCMVEENISLKWCCYS